MAPADGDDSGPLLLGAGLAILILPLLVLGLSAPLWVGVLAAATALVGAAAAQRLQRPRIAALPAPAQSATRDARAALARLEAARADICDRDVRATIEAMIGSARTIVEGVVADPAALGQVQRVLTYYLPRAAALAASYAALEARGDTARRAAVARVIARLDAAFRRYADRFADDALRLLDLELKLVDSALDEDLGEARTESRAEFQNRGGTG